MFARLLTFCVVIVAIFGLGLFLGRLVSPAPPPPPPQIANTATILRQVQTLSHLVTVKYVLEKVVILEDVKWYGENRVLMVAHGIAKAGVDLSKLNDRNITVSGKTLRIKLPKAMVTDVYLDDKRTQVLERSTGIMRTFDKDLEQSARRQAVDEIRVAARLNGIVKDADDRARTILENLFLNAGYDRVEFVD